MFDIQKFCKDYGITYSVGEHWIQFNCFFCPEGDSGNHLGYSIDKEFFHCWRCGYHSIWEMIKKKTLIFQNHLIKEIINKYQIGHKSKLYQYKIDEVKLKNKKLKPPANMGPLSEQHKKYLKDRGFDPKQLEQEWNLQGTQHLSSSWNWRIIIPIYNEINQIVAYQGRIIRENISPKYKFSNSKNILCNPNSMLYGIHKIKNSKSVIIVEGVTGVWRIGPGSVATFGINWHIEQANILRKFQNRYILFDPEIQAQKKAHELAHWLSLFPGNTEIISGFDTDPGELSEKNIIILHNLL